ncbi:unnamed protein product [Caenorhabditis brenneri]
MTSTALSGSRTTHEEEMVDTMRIGDKLTETSHQFAVEWERVFVTGTLLTNKAIDDFVEKWMQGNFPKLKHVVVVSKKFENRATVAGRVPPIFEPEVLPLHWKEIRDRNYK